MKKSLIIIIAILALVIAFVVGFFGAKILTEKKEKTEDPSVTVEGTTQEETVAESEIITETENETETETETETQVSTTEAKVDEVISTDYYTISVPAAWQGEYTYTVSEKESDGSYRLSMVHKDSYGVGFGGNLFMIGLYSVESGSGKEVLELAPVPLEYLGVLKVPGVGDFDVIVTLPSDAQFRDDMMNDYNKLFDSKESVFETLTPLNGATFEKAQ